MIRRIAVSFALAIPLLAERQLAISIDDLPCAGKCSGLADMQSVTKRLLTALRGVPAIGFVNETQLHVAGQRDARVALLDQWLDGGFELGNHTFSHPDANRLSLADYQANVLKGEVIFRPMVEARKKGGKLYFRHPFTHTGPTAEYKAGLEAFLAAHGYEIAPFTIENEDYIWTVVYRDALDRKDTEMAQRIQRSYLEHLSQLLQFAEQTSKKLFQREIPQILLIHANTLNADTLSQMLELFRSRDYAIVSIGKALEDPAYRTPDHYVDRVGPSWLHRWGLALGIRNPMQGEPEPPKWVHEAYQRLQR